MKKDAWVLRLKDEFNDSGVPQYYTGNDEDEGLSDDLREANIINDKDVAETWMKKWEEAIFAKFGEGAICNAGYTHMMKHFEWVQVEVEEVDIA
ncbi:hypothetical protein R6U77_00835 [Lysinibacillus louembei]|uniref:Uncharacterized protein n=1 Tax=Lysinibacillus louembei TaxID=1470088 RepID=A0ABZ0RVK0_9BACI|nr:hypothetical protein [Lysinibacillus louembei]WPK12264.1 hypothetical protein R6U77_00835 [Lysinibacillus louembei]